MIYIYSFLFPGIVCLIGELILDNSKLSAGHITSLFTCLGVVLSFLNVYNFFIDKCGMGATILITNFGNALYQSSLQGYYSNGIIGIFSNMLSQSSLVITVTIIISFFLSLVFNPKD